MHPLCYINLSNIEVPQPTPSAYMQKLEDLIHQVPSASHARIDEIWWDIFSVRFRGRREVLVQRRAELVRSLRQRIASQARALHNRARMDAFIGPLTIQQRNGHPF
jgi:hypothetical protein